MHFALPLILLMSTQSRFLSQLLCSGAKEVFRVHRISFSHVSTVTLPALVRGLWLNVFDGDGMSYTQVCTVTEGAGLNPPVGDPPPPLVRTGWYKQYVGDQSSMSVIIVITNPPHKSQPGLWTRLQLECWSRRKTQVECRCIGYLCCYGDPIANPSLCRS